MSSLETIFKFKDTVTFDDVLLVPQMSTIRSRSEIDISLKLGKAGNLSMPIVSSPMDTVTGEDMASTLGALGVLPIVHRYNTNEEQVKLVTNAKKRGAKIIGAAVGVTGDFMQRVRGLIAAGANVVCFDIAHGHHVLLKEAIAKFRDEYGESFHVMAGNVATRQAFEDLSDWGADSIRVGIGGGSICSTRIKTGHGVPTLQSILDCAASDRPAMIIADGGIRTPGDIVKAIAAGADLVMLGSMLAGTTEAPGEIIDVIENVQGKQVCKKYKKYRGMASVEAQIDWRGHTASVEGVTSRVPYKGDVKGVVNSIENGIRSGLSYSGAKDIKHFQISAKFIKQTNAGLQESRTHVHNL